MCSGSSFKSFTNLFFVYSDLPATERGASERFKTKLLFQRCYNDELFSGIPDPASRDPGSRIPDPRVPGSGIRDPATRIWDPGLGDPGSGDPGSVIPGYGIREPN